MPITQEEKKSFEEVLAKMEVTEIMGLGQLLYETVVEAKLDSRELESFGVAFLKKAPWAAVPNTLRAPFVKASDTYFKERLPTIFKNQESGVVVAGITAKLTETAELIGLAKLLYDSIMAMDISEDTFRAFGKQFYARSPWATVPNKIRLPTVNTAKEFLRQNLPGLFQVIEPVANENIDSLPENLEKEIENEILSEQTEEKTPKVEPKQKAEPTEHVAEAKPAEEEKTS